MCTLLSWFLPSYQFKIIWELLEDVWQFRVFKISCHSNEYFCYCFSVIFNVSSIPCMNTGADTRFRQTWRKLLQIKKVGEGVFRCYRWKSGEIVVDLGLLLKTQESGSHHIRIIQTTCWLWRIHVSVQRPPANFSGNGTSSVLPPQFNLFLRMAKYPL